MTPEIYIIIILGTVLAYVCGHGMGDRFARYALRGTIKNQLEQIKHWRTVSETFQTVAFKQEESYQQQLAKLEKQIDRLVRGASRYTPDELIGMEIDQRYSAFEAERDKKERMNDASSS